MADSKQHDWIKNGDKPWTCRSCNFRTANLRHIENGFCRHDFSRTTAIGSERHEQITSCIRCGVVMNANNPTKPCIGRVDIVTRVADSAPVPAREHDLSCNIFGCNRVCSCWCHTSKSPAQPQPVAAQQGEYFCAGCGNPVDENVPCPRCSQPVGIELGTCDRAHSKNNECVNWRPLPAVAAQGDDGLERELTEKFKSVGMEHEYECGGQLVDARCHTCRGIIVARSVLARERREWIAVTERLPETGTIVRVWDAEWDAQYDCQYLGGTVHEGHHDTGGTDGSSWSAAVDREPSFHITDWQPLPEPPIRKLAEPEKEGR